MGLAKGQAPLNSGWSSGTYDPPIPNNPTKFELMCQRLKLETEAEIIASEPLKRWANKNKEYRYVPEYLLIKWGMSVDFRSTGGAL